MSKVNQLHFKSFKRDLNIENPSNVCLYINKFKVVSPPKKSICNNQPSIFAFSQYVNIAKK